MAEASSRPILDLIAEAQPAPDPDAGEPAPEYDVEFSVFGDTHETAEQHPSTPIAEPPPAQPSPRPIQQTSAPSLHNEDASLPRLIMGRYQLAHILGRGAMGDVWLARDIQQDCPVAVKFLKEELDSKDFEARFWREARILTRLRHPNVIALLDYGADPMPFLVMELLRGKDLARVIKTLRRLRISIAAEIFRQACAGLDHVHKAGVIHRDLKPANIFCVENGPMKIIDFGLAKRPHMLSASSDIGSGDGSTVEKFHTQAGLLVGTLKYMSPEQLSRREIDFRTDLWAMGVVLFRMLTGQPAFDGETEIDLLLAITAGATPTPSTFVHDMPRQVDAFFERAFQKKPERRFSSAIEMAEAFSSIAAAAASKA